MSGQTIGLCVVDDHMIIYDGLRAMCEHEPGLRFVGSAVNAAECLALVSDQRPDLVLLDLRIGSDNGFDLCRRLRAFHPRIGVLVFSAFGNAELLSQAIRAGANGYVLKDTNTTQLPAIIRAFRTAGSYFDPRIAGPVLIDSLTPGGLTAARQLSDRELQIVRLIAAGSSNYDIAAELNLSPHTVKFHISTLLRRFGVRRRAELVRVAMDRMLLP